MTGLFEAELLIELMLRYWQHPFAEDSDFRLALLNNAADVLQSAVESPDDDRMIQGLRGGMFNLVSATWYAEWCAVHEGREATESELAARQVWLETLRRALPSCFCDPNLLE